MPSLELIIDVLTQEKQPVDSKFKARCLEVAAQSPCKNRKVGAILVSVCGTIVGEGYNHSTEGLPCEDASGATESHVVHAEVACMENYDERYRNYDFVDTPTPSAMYVTHNPCSSCLGAIRARLGKVQILVVESFMKFDSDKLRYDLVPAEWSEGDAEILTHGAKKYKPDNWREVDDIGRYYAALERHLKEFKKYLETGDKSKLYDSDSGLHHMKHLRTNAGFLLTLTENINEAINSD